MAGDNLIRVLKRYVKYVAKYHTEWVDPYVMALVLQHTIDMA